jgi:hypothetical protein
MWSIFAFSSAFLADMACFYKKAPHVCINCCINQQYHPGFPPAAQSSNQPCRAAAGNKKGHLSIPFFTAFTACLKAIAR